VACIGYLYPDVPTFLYRLSALGDVTLFHNYFSTPIIAVLTKVGTAGFSAIFFDRSYTFAPALLDVQHLNDSTDALDFHGVLMASLRAFDQH